LISTLQAQRYLLAKDFAPVSLVASTPFLIVIGPAVPVKSLAELIAYAKARPGQLAVSATRIYTLQRTVGGQSFRALSHQRSYR
jgi:tripartite-type tricarboxylate transporter receptor subunit TctC